MRKRARKISHGTLLENATALLTSDLPQTWNQAALFGSVAPLELEIGSGRGLFITQVSAAIPNRHFLGVEISKKYAAHCASLIAQKQLSNAVMIYGDAYLVLKDYLPDESLTAVHIYFPDPWWKRRHRKRRIVCESVIELVWRRLVVGGKLHFWTDVEEYFLAGLKSIAAVSGFERFLESPDKTNAEQIKQSDGYNFDYRTHFERRTLGHGETVYRSLFVKKF
ncbi:MAG: tRNA (guanosine(46)-N7)-methyltransferase TrmB [Planctomycetaceae bacterium]|jgi:tRNA (guanine-N7-)-methyltransferase|nr:tRNA (guanosine(46)-N7)-methyltransferase TrmB [Planctomycetaceae bacterium]